MGLDGKAPNHRLRHDTQKEFGGTLGKSTPCF